MLILNRRRGEAVDLKDRRTGRILASVQVMEITPEGVVRLAFDAGQEIQILRDNARRRDDGQATAIAADEDTRGNR